MKKITITLLSFVMATSVAHATIFNMGPRIGGSISQLNVKEASKTAEYKKLELKSGLGYHAGFFTRFSFPLVYIQPELLVSGSGASFKANSKEIKLRFTKVDVPAMVGLSFFENKLRLQAGPVFSALLSAVEEDKQLGQEHYENVTLAWQAGIGMDIWNLVVDIKYEGNLSGFGNKIGQLKAKHGYGQWMFSVGFNIL